MEPRLVLLMLLSLPALACASGNKSASPPRLFDEDQYAKQAAEPPVETVDMPLTELSRQEVNQTVDEGLGRFLQEVHVEKSLVDGKFEGFRIIEFRDPQQWQGTGLHPGDVVTSVNDQPIERPEQAYAVFASLKTADSLEVTYLRDGAEMRLSLPIVARSEPSEPEPSEPEPSEPEPKAQDGADDSGEPGVSDPAQREDAEGDGRADGKLNGSAH